jgi:iron complex outermembrane receptor protein
MFNIPWLARWHTNCKVRIRSIFQQECISMNSRVPFRLSPIAALIAGLSMLPAAPLHAADDKSVVELQAEVARITAENARLKQALEALHPSAATAPAAAPEVAPKAPASEQAKKEIAKQDEPVSLDAIEVHTRNRIERLQDVPLSESVVTGKELERLGATDVAAILKRAGNISWNRGNQRTFSLSLRGIGKQAQTEAQDPAVGVIVDGVPYAYNALSSSFDFTDIDSVEVARGPQGTLLGKNASLGAVYINTKHPAFTPDASYSLTFGERDTTKVQAAGGGAIVDDLLAWRGSFSASKARGPLVNSYNQDITSVNTDRLAGRVQFLLTPSADFSARIALDSTPRGGETTNSNTINTPTPAYYANGKPNTSISNDARLQRSWFTQQSAYSYASGWLNGGADGSSFSNDSARPLVTGSNGASAELNWNLGTHTVTSITAYKDYHFDAVNDEGSPFDVYRNSGGFWNDYKQVSQELRLSSQAGGFVDYQGGLFLMDVKNFNDYRRVWGNDAGAWFASSDTVNASGAVTKQGQYTILNRDAAGRLLMLNSLANLSMDYNSPTGIQHIHNQSNAIFGQANWHFTDQLTVTTGLRLTHENRTNSGSSGINSNGNAPELNPVVVNGVNLGGFNTTSSGSVYSGLIGAGSAVANIGYLNTTDATQVALANALAQKYFGVATYAQLTGQQAQQVAAAKAIRAAAIGVVFNTTQADPYRKTLPAYVISPTYKVNDNLTTYASLQHGEKAGVSQLTNGISNQVKEEKTTAYELGFKSALLDKTLIFDADIFLMNVQNYQQTTQVLDAYTTAANNNGTIYYTNATGNVPKVQAKGLEVDGIYGGIRNTTIRFAGAYNDARYKEYRTSAVPVEWNFSGNPYGNYRDISGQTLTGAAKWTYNLGVDYRIPVLADKEFHTSANVVYTSKWNSDVALSDYAWVPASYIVDWSIGLGAPKKGFDVSLLVKNLFNDKTHLTQTWNTYTPADPRWIGISFSGKI